MSEMSRAAASPGTDPIGAPTGSSPTRYMGEVAPGGTGPAAALDAQSEGEVSTRSPQPGLAALDAATSASDPRPSLWRPAFVDNDARDIPTTWEPVTVKEGVL